jgi:hypothetical protein
MNTTVVMPAALTAMLIAYPAHATGGLVCRTAATNPVEISMVISHTAVSSVVSARLIDRGRAIPVQVAQAWIEPSEIRLDLADPNMVLHELRLRATRKGQTYDGSVWRSGQRRWVRCREG